MPYQDYIVCMLTSRFWVLRSWNYVYTYDVQRWLILLCTYVVWVGLWGCIIIFKVTFIIVNLDQKLSKSWCFKIPLKYRFYRSVSHFVKNSLINLLFAYYILNSTSISPVCSTKEIYKRAIIRVRLVIHFQTVFLSIV